jgi:hypothetical protein
MNLIYWFVQIIYTINGLKKHSSIQLFKTLLLQHYTTEWCNVLSGHNLMLTKIKKS